MEKPRWRTMRNRSDDIGGLLQSNEGWTIEERLWVANRRVVDCYVVTSPEGITSFLYNGMAHAKKWARNRPIGGRS